MKLIDISMSLQEGMAVYEGDPRFRVERVHRLVPGNPDTWNTSLLQLGTHVGTHVDAARHFDDRGTGVDGIGLEVLCGPVRVLDLRGRGPRIDGKMLGGYGIEGVERLLLRTDSERFAGGPFNPNYTSLTLDAACRLRGEGVRLIGIDSPSVEAFDSPGMPVHQEFLKRDPVMVVVEGLDLTRADAGDYELCCLPLKLVGGDGAPARAVLIRR
jgi:arylformamidase